MVAHNETVLFLLLDNLSPYCMPNHKCGLRVCGWEILGYFISVYMFSRPVIFKQGFSGISKVLYYSYYNTTDIHKAIFN